jgi:transketolase
MGLSLRVVNVSCLKPENAAAISRFAADVKGVVTAEEHSIIGGLGGAVTEILCGGRPVPVERVGIADTFARTAPDTESLMDAYGLAVEDIVVAAKRALARK